MEESNNISKELEAESIASVDPSNTSNIGDKVDQGVISVNEGISEQVNKWEDGQSQSNPDHIDSDNVEHYIKNPSPADNDTLKSK